MISYIKRKIPYNLSIRKYWWITKGALAFLKNKDILKWIEIVWITWTDWKTTTTCFAAQLLQLLWVKTAMMSSEVHSINWKTIPNKSKRTTAWAGEIFKFIKQAKSEWCKIIILEVSSHALEQGRVFWIEFDYAIITNFSQEHLDYHVTMKSYAESKAQLFSKTKKCVILPRNLTERKIFEKEIQCDIIETYFWDNLRNENILNASNLRYSNHWTYFDLHYKKQIINDIFLPVIWDYNVENLLFAIGLVSLIQRDNVQMTLKEAISKLEKVPWRLDDLNFGQNYKIWLSYAVTPKALEKNLRFWQEVKEQSWKVWVVYWATWGQHDRQKRPIMWEISWIYADYSVITDDETYWEDSLEIIRDVEKWIIWTKWNYQIIPDRKEAIFYTLNNAKKWDIVIVTGLWSFDSRNIWWIEEKWSDKEVIGRFFN